MRTYGALSPINGIPMPADTFGAVVISSAGAVATFDWPAGVQLAAFSGPMNFWVNWLSTNAAVPSTASAGTTVTSGANELNPTIRQVTTSLSTGYSVSADSSGVIGTAFWRK